MPEVRIPIFCYNAGLMCAGIDRIMNGGTFVPGGSRSKHEDP